MNLFKKTIQLELGIVTQLQFLVSRDVIGGVFEVLLFGSEEENIDLSEAKHNSLSAEQGE